MDVQHVCMHHVQHCMENVLYVFMYVFMYCKYVCMHTVCRCIIMNVCSITKREYGTYCMCVFC